MVVDGVHRVDTVVLLSLKSFVMGAQVRISQVESAGAYCQDRMELGLNWS